MFEGSASYDFEANDIAEDWREIAQMAVAASFRIDDVKKLGIHKNELVDGVRNEDGSYTFSNKEFLKTDVPSSFSFVQNGKVYSGDYKGIAVIKVNEKGGVERLAISGFTTLKMNGEDILKLDGQADIFLEKTNRRFKMEIADKNKTIKPVVNKLNEK
jgi:hypothetical protein